MAQINVMMWNIQDFGWRDSYRGNYTDTCNFIAQAVLNAQTDILMIQEVHQTAVSSNYLGLLLNALNALPAPMNNWSYEWIKGAIATFHTKPFATSNDLVFDGAHSEGYAVFINLNLSKFTPQQAAPVFDPATPGVLTANTQSSGMISGSHGPLPGDLTSTNNFVGSTIPAHGGGPAPLAPGVVSLPAGTVIGPGGIKMSGLGGGAPDFTVIPGGYQLTERWDLPVANELILPKHSFALVTVGRRFNSTAGRFVPYNPGPGGPPNVWQYLEFSDNGVWKLTKMRRPAFVTIKLNRNTATAAHGPKFQFIPIHVYHAPSKEYSAWRNTVAASASHSLYQVYNWNVAGPLNAANWIEPQCVVIGGDINYALDPSNTPYTDFTNSYAGGGANCQVVPTPPATNYTDGIRINHPAVAPSTDPAKNPLNKTTVNLNVPPYGPGTEILDQDINGYRRMAIDNIFYGGFDNAETPVDANFGSYYDILTSIQGNGAGPLRVCDFSSALIQGLLDNYLEQVTGHDYANQPGPVPAIHELNNTASFIEPFTSANGFYSQPGGGAGAFAAGAADAARAAAEFTNLLVSDHMPVLFSMNL